MALPPKTCPECGEEYVHTAAVCVHCEVPLVDLGEAPEPASAPSDLPPASELTPVRVASSGWALSLSELLVGEGIAHRVEQVSRGEGGPGRLAWGVYVREADVPRAQVLDAELLRREIPDVPEAWDAPAEGDGCPACGAAAPADAPECPDCGLALGGPE